MTSYCRPSLNATTWPTADHDLYCWGHQNYGQLGDGTGSTTGTGSYLAAPKLILSGISNANSDTLAMGVSSSCAVTSGGGAKCWGLNDVGQLGDATTGPKNAPVDVSGLTSGVSRIYIPADTNKRACAVLSDETVRCWGSNATYGTLGNDSLTNSSSPVTVKLAAGGNLSGVTKLAMGTYYTVALLTDGTLRCWGINSNSECGDGTNTSPRKTAVSVTGLSGTVSELYIGQDGATTSATANATCAQVGSKVQCWGFHATYDILGTNTHASSKLAVDVLNFDSNVTSYSIGLKHTCGVFSNGQVKCRGQNDDGVVGCSPQVRGPTALTGYE
jgi:alpha-tubulin suppressor-like RCC1 family protein